jgi:hypothetical protein
MFIKIQPLGKEGEWALYRSYFEGDCCGLLL